MDIKLIVAAHKPYRMPEDPVYFPVHAGAEGQPDLGYVPDNSGDNISIKNSTYCELTALYWAWRNLRADYIGLVHYRRHFTASRSAGDKFDRIITGKQLEKVLDGSDIILPKPRHYFIETNYTQYAYSHHHEDLDTAKAIIKEKHPEFVKAFDNSMQKTSGHRFNMFIMKYDKFDAYCEWLFDILFELEKRLDISGYSPYDSRVFGFVGERLLDVWIEGAGYSYTELPYLLTENQNWIIKGFSFLKRSVYGRLTRGKPDR